MYTAEFIKQTLADRPDLITISMSNAQNASTRQYTHKIRDDLEFEFWYQDKGKGFLRVVDTAAGFGSIFLAEISSNGKYNPLINGDEESERKISVLDDLINAYVARCSY